MKTVRLRGKQEEIPVGKILCMGRNFAEHARELGNEVPTSPILFIKPATAIISNGEAIVRPAISKLLHHEVELVVLIGKTGKDIPASRAMEHVLGYGVGLDMTLRDVQEASKKKGLPWAVSKGFDTSAALSEFVPASFIKDPHNVTVRCYVNGTVRQEGSTSMMMFSIPTIIEFASKIFTLEAGDLIYTGTPPGVAEVVDGDIVEGELVGFVKTKHPVRTA
jgi:acylpyruvate hydrolase